LDNTYYAVDNRSWGSAFDRDFRHFPRHLGVTWHFRRSPQEIYEMTKKLISTCLDITPNSGKFEAFPEHLQREVSKCAEEISQQAVYTTTVHRPAHGLAHCVVAENYLQVLKTHLHFTNKTLQCLPSSSKDIISWNTGMTPNPSLISVQGNQRPHVIKG